MNKLTIAIAAMAAMFAVADENEPIVRVVTNENGKVVRKVDRSRLEAVMAKRTGGKILVPDSLNGKLVYVNAQTRAPVEWLKENAETFARGTKLNIEVAAGEFKFPNPEIQGDGSLFVIDDPSMPPILSAPESRWAMVNVAPLAKGLGEKPKFFAARVQKELTRGFSLLAGAQNSNYPDSLMGGITGADDLDRFVDCRLPVDVLNRFAPYLKPFGVTPAVETTYRKACEEGWAPAPTNEYQQAIWDKVHAIPANPMKIEFDPKKGR